MGKLPSLLNDRYRLLRPLSTGGFGQTFLAEDTHLPSGRCCVVKKLRPIVHDPATAQLVRERFQREAAILESLGAGHSQIPKLYAYFSDGQDFYLVQEWIEGDNLQEMGQRRHRLPEHEVRQLLLETLPVLSYVHHQGIVHRDIKPANIILRQSDQQPVLIDFGVAKELAATIVDALGQSSIIVGTPGFMPVEQAIGKPVYASDLYSLSLTAIYLLTGELPGHDRQSGQLVWPDADFSPEFVQVLRRASQQQPGDRYPTAQAMLADLTRQAPSVLVPLPTVPIAQVNREQVPALPLGAPVAVSSGQQDYRYRQILINKVRHYWISGVLEASLHGRAVMVLGLDERRDLLEHPWDVVWMAGTQPQVSLPPGTSILHHFDRLGSGKTLLILGDPGSGKTTTLLELARDLLQRIDLNGESSIPVVFNLSCWSRDRLPIDAWLVQELHQKYQVSREIGRGWVQQELLLPLLDGLDEVNLGDRQACVQALNQFHQDYGRTELVVCSRLKDYEQLQSRLCFQAALLIKPLTLEQAQIYLEQAGEELAALRLALQRDRVLQDLVRSPLILSIMMLTYQNLSMTDLPSLNLEERRSHLFETYIDRMFQRRGQMAPYSLHQVRRWLQWLAAQMMRSSQSIFLIEQLQPHWLRPGIQHWLYALSIGLVAAFCCGIGGLLAGQILFGRLAGIYSGLLFGTAGAFMAILFYGFIHHEIQPIETLKWSMPKAKRGLRSGLMVGLASGIVLGLSLSLLYGPLLVFNEGLLYGLIYGMVAGLGVGLVYVLMQGLQGPGVELKTSPNQGMWQSMRHAAFFALLGEIGLGLTATLAGIPALIGVTTGLLFGLLGAGEACVKHLMLRVILYSYGLVPWNYAQFLDYATRLIFLQKVGGGYIFIHRLLLEHFAVTGPLQQQERRQ